MFLENIINVCKSFVEKSNFKKTHINIRFRKIFLLSVLHYYCRSYTSLLSPGGIAHHLQCRLQNPKWPQGMSPKMANMVWKEVLGPIQGY